MNAQRLFEAGELDEAIAVLGAQLRNRPDHIQHRTFLFELLCFAGDYDRAQKHLDVLSSGPADRQRGAWSYVGALAAERTRQEMFLTGDIPNSETGPVRGSLNGRPFSMLTDADPRIQGRLELYARGQYSWIPLESVARIIVEPPTNIRDLLWLPAQVALRHGDREEVLGEVIIPGMAPGSADNADPSVRLGRAADWIDLPEGGVAPVGLKLLYVDGDLIPWIDVRELVVDGPSAS